MRRFPKLRNPAAATRYAAFRVDGVTVCDECFIEMTEARPDLKDADHWLDNAEFLLLHGETVHDNNPCTACAGCGAKIEYDVTGDPAVLALRRASGTTPRKR